MEKKLNKEIGQRSTRQRSLLLELISNTKGHPDADELYRQGRERQPSLSLSTVYRNLELFKRLGLIEEHELTGGHRCYEIKAKARHYHLLCLGCGQVLEFRCPASDKLIEDIGKERGFKVIDAEVRLVGYCSQCQKRGLGSSEPSDKK